jgi:hypothetical protein
VQDPDDQEEDMRLARRSDPDRTAVLPTILIVLTALLLVSWGALRVYRIEVQAAAREQDRPSSVIVRPRADPAGQPVAPGHGSPQPEEPAGTSGPSVSGAGCRSGGCILVWVP